MSIDLTASLNSDDENESYKETLLSLLEEGAIGSCVSSGKVETDCELQVKDLGRVGVPLTNEQMSKLTAIMEQAPYGKGEATVLDPSVRKAWQLDSWQIKLGYQWNTSALDQIVVNACNQLGIDKAALGVEAHLYKLLCYEVGGHFKKHRDSEKEPGMFGTLLVHLPSVYEGGKLVIEHKTQNYDFDFATGGAQNTQYVAFFADCEHTVEPVTSGVRLVLAYNLVRTKAPARYNSNFSLADKATKDYDDLVAAMKRWAFDADRPEKLAVMLDHKYTQANLSFEGLKGDDRKKLERLIAIRDPAAPRSPLLEVHLCLVEKYVSGSGDEGGYDYRGYGRYRGSSDCHMEEEHETTISTKLWVGPNGPVELPNVKVDLEEDSTELLGSDPAFDSDDEPDQKDSEATGNEGVTVEYWYFKSVLVFWLKKDSMRIACKADINTALQLVQHEFAQGQTQAMQSLAELVDYVVRTPSLLGDPNTKRDVLVGKVLKLCRNACSSATPSIYCSSSTSSTTTVFNSNESSVAGSSVHGNPSSVVATTTLQKFIAHLSAVHEPIAAELTAHQRQPSHYNTELPTRWSIGICGSITATELAACLHIAPTSTEQLALAKQLIQATSTANMHYAASFVEKLRVISISEPTRFETSLLEQVADAVIVATTTVTVEHISRYELGALEQILSMHCRFARDCDALTSLLSKCAACATFPSNVSSLVQRLRFNESYNDNKRQLLVTLFRDHLIDYMRAIKDEAMVTLPAHSVETLLSLTIEFDSDDNVAMTTFYDKCSRRLQFSGFETIAGFGVRERSNGTYATALLDRSQTLFIGALSTRVKSLLDPDVAALTKPSVEQILSLLLRYDNTDTALISFIEKSKRLLPFAAFEGVATIVINTTRSSTASKIALLVPLLSAAADAINRPTRTSGTDLVSLLLGLLTVSEKHSNAMEPLQNLANKVISTRPTCLFSMFEANAARTAVTRGNPVFRQLLQRCIDTIPDVEPVFSWCMPQAICSTSNAVQDFLRGPTQTMRMAGFSGINQARIFAMQYSQPMHSRGASADNKNFTVSCSASGTGKNAAVTITKTRGWFEEQLRKFSANKIRRTQLTQLLRNSSTNPTSTNSGNSSAGAAAVIGNDTAVIDLVGQKRSLASTSSNKSTGTTANAAVDDDDDEVIEEVPMKMKAVEVIEID